MLKPYPLYMGLFGLKSVKHENLPRTKQRPTVKRECAKRRPWAQGGHLSDINVHERGAGELTNSETGKKREAALGPQTALI